MDQKQRIVVKVPSSIFFQDATIVSDKAFKEFAENLSQKQESFQIILTLSGLEQLGKSKLLTYSDSAKQAAASLGFMQLVKLSQFAFTKPFTFFTLNKDTFNDQTRRISAFRNIQVILDQGILPIIVGDIFDNTFDEDTLAAETAILCEANKLLLFSYVNGLFTADPKIDPTAQQIPTIEKLTDTQLNTPGIGNKLKAAKICQDAGIDTIIISNFSFSQNLELGTLVKARKIIPLITQIKEELNSKGLKAKQVSYVLASLSTQVKNQALNKAAEYLILHQNEIIEANKIDLKEAEARGIRGALLDRLMLDSKRISSMAKGLVQVADLDDPIGELICLRKRPNGLGIGQRRVPLGVIGIIYEARPNVTADAFALCLKTSNAVILRGGKEAIRSNMAVVKVIQAALTSCQVPAEAVQLVEITDRQSAVELMRLNEFIDVIIPRGGADLIKTVVKNSTVPVIETGAGNCHVYVDAYANLQNAVNITFNAKTQRVSVCNAIETLLIHKDVAAQMLPLIVKKLKEKNVEVRGDERVLEIIPDAVPATEKDFWTEYLDYIIAVKIVDSLEEAITHINKYGTRNSDAIVTENYSNAQQFMNDVDSAVVYVNASTRFTDGFEFGFGAEIGISTQKMHARGPMGLKELTSTKYVVYGNGQIRDQVL